MEEEEAWVGGLLSLFFWATLLMKGPLRVVCGKHEEKSRPGGESEIK